MSYCKHEWQDRSAVLREVFRDDPDRRVHEFFVCVRCLRISERAAARLQVTHAPAELTGRGEAA